jgi:glucosylceramidase
MGLTRLYQPIVITHLAEQCHFDDNLSHFGFKMPDLFKKWRDFFNLELANNIEALKGFRLGIVIALLTCLACSIDKPPKTTRGEVSVWITSGDKTSLLKESSELINFAEGTTELPVIELDPVQKFQTIDGFGFSLTGGSAMLLQRMAPSKRESLLRELFLSGDNSIGISYLRISIGSSDLDDQPFTYDDRPYGKKDPALEKFSLKKSRRFLIPILQQILAINPNIEIMASPWSAPAWMKTNQNLKGGHLRPEYYEAYTRYLVHYLKDIAKEGIRIDAMTLQNEPENPKNNPSMLMTAEEETRFVKDNLGPAFRHDSISTKIIVFDHNCDHPEYPIKILDDDLAKKFIDGAAFHLYLGDISALSRVHRAHPDRNIYFTEQWTSGRGNFSEDLSWHTKNLIIGATRNWSRIVLEWNLASDPEFYPHTSDGGCTECMGAITIGNGITRNVSYYIIAQASKFVPSGSVRIASTEADNLPNVAFITPEGKRILIVLNDSEVKATFAIQISGKNAIASLPAKSVGTFIW